MTLPPRSFAKRNRDGRLRSPSHLAFVRKFMCIAHRHGGCFGKIEACHVRDVAPMGHGGAKPDDAYVVSMCRAHHFQSEKREGEWGRNMGLDVLSLALEFAAASPDKAIREAAKAARHENANVQPSVGRAVSDVVSGGAGGQSFGYTESHVAPKKRM